jgi:arylsulfatase A-like enzyme
MGWTGTSLEMIKGNAATRSDFYQTPYLEELASHGMRFSQAYSPAALCTPSRAAVLTGKTPAELKITTPGSGNAGNSRKMLTPTSSMQLPKELPTIGTLLKAEGYATALLGKWHIGHRDHAGMYGFDFHDGATGNESNGTASDPKEIYSLTARGIEFMKQQVQADKPFYLQLSHYAVHSPIETLDASKERFKELPAGKYHSDTGYAGMTWDLDRSIGSLMNAIQTLGIADSTYMIFMSDNGAPGSPRRPNNAPLSSGKGTLYEGGIRVPFIIAGPGILPGTISNEAVTGCDLLPTICEWAGIDARNTDGSSLMPLLSGKAVEMPRSAPLLFHFPHYGASPNQKPSTAIIEDHYKLLKDWETGSCKLFNLAEDRNEERNLAESEPVRLKEMVTRMEGRLAAVDAQLPQPNPDYDPNADSGTRRRRTRDR